MGDEYRWPLAGVPDLRDGLSMAEVVQALYAPVALRMDNRVPADGADILGGLRANRRRSADHRGLHPH